MLPATSAHIQFASRFLKQLAHLGHAFFGFLDRDEVLGGLILLGRKLAHFLADLHRAELGPAHAAEMRGLGAFGGDAFGESPQSLHRPARDCGDRLPPPGGTAPKRDLIYVS